MNKIASIILALGFLIAGLGVGYYYGIHLPSKTNSVDVAYEYAKKNNITELSGYCKKYHDTMLGCMKYLNEKKVNANNKEVQREEKIEIKETQELPKEGILNDLLIDCEVPLNKKTIEYHEFECTDDCSGHKAGYKWACEKYQDGEEFECGGNSESFYEGCLIFNLSH